MLGAIKVFVASLLIGVSSFFGARTSTIPTPIPTPFVDDYKLLSMVNDYRSSKRLSTYTTDYEVCSIGQRIIDNTFWQTDINLNNYKDICSTCTSLSVAESQNQYNLDFILSGWESNKSTQDTLTGGYKHACVKVENDKVVLVTANKSSVTAGSGQKTTTSITPSRTGAIITYHEWCSNKDISIYQNELITKKSSDGKTYSMTQGDWDCYEKYLANRGGGATYVYNPVVTYPPCTVYYPLLGYSQTYYYTSPETCKSWQDQASSVTVLPPVQTQTTAPVQQAPQITKSQCQASVNDKYGSLMRSYGCYYPCPATGDCGSSSVCEAYWYQAQKDMNSCNQYP